MNTSVSTHPLYKAAIEARDYVTNGRTGHAIAVLMDAVGSRGGVIAERLNVISDDYRRVVDSLMRAEDDPCRESVVDNINRRMLDLITMIEHAVLSIDMPTLYFSTVRYLKRTAGVDFTSLHNKLRDAVEANEMSPGVETQKEIENVGRDLFFRLWTGFPLSEIAVEQVEQIITSEAYPISLRCQLVSALTLGQLEYHDERRIVMLLKLYINSTERPVALRALCGALLSLWRHRDRQVSDKVRSMLTVISDNQRSCRDIITAYKQFIRSRDTERITRKMNEEVIPEMLKLRPDLDKFARRHKDDDILSMDENPQWEEMFDRSGLKDRLMELSKMQADGGDVFMGTFSSLKHFPFFKDISNWFLPFDVSHSNFQNDEYEDLRPIIRSIADAPVLCDNDKYSMAMALKGLSPAQRSMISSRMGDENKQMSEIINTELLPEDKRDESYLNHYVQDLYRFYKLFPRAGEVYNPFAEPINLVVIDGLDMVFCDADVLELIGEFYFRRRYYDEAVDVFKRLEQISIPSMDLYQKIAHCLRRQGKNEEALDYLMKADLIDGENVWTLRNIGACQAAIGNWEMAREYYSRALANDDADVRIYNALIGIDMELKQYARAAEMYLAMSLKDVKITPAMRTRQARLEVMAGNIAESMVIFRELEDGGYRLTGLDVASRGHAEWQAGLGDDAVASWRMAMKMEPYSQMQDDDAAMDILDVVESSGFKDNAVKRNILIDIITK